MVSCPGPPSPKSKGCGSSPMWPSKHARVLSRDISTTATGGREQTPSVFGTEKRFTLFQQARDTKQQDPGWSKGPVLFSGGSLLVVLLRAHAWAAAPINPFFFALSSAGAYVLLQKLLAVRPQTHLKARSKSTAVPQEKCTTRKRQTTHSPEGKPSCFW